MRAPGWFRLMRAGSFAAVCVALSQFGHDLMASRPAPVWSGWAALAGVTGLGYVLSDRRRSAWWLVLAVELTQIFLHFWFVNCTPSGVPSAQAHMRMQGGGMHMTGVMPHSGSSSPGMVGVHALVGVLVALWLCAGERALWRALRLIANSLAGPALRLYALLVRTPLAGLPPTGIEVTRGEVEAAPAPGVLQHILVRRGPPRAAVSLALTSF